jgi:hypothetical protein
MWKEMAYLSICNALVKLVLSEVGRKELGGYDTAFGRGSGGCCVVVDRDVLVGEARRIHNSRSGGVDIGIESMAGLKFVERVSSLFLVLEGTRSGTYRCVGR